MISFDFEYYRPDSVDEAVQTFRRLAVEGKTPMYYAGGAEVISMSRANRIRPGAVIDIKGIPECNALEVRGDTIVIGAAVNQSRVCESNIIPLLTMVLRRSADRTLRNRITIGGNICGSLPYRESILPFLLFDSSAGVAGPDGLRYVPIGDLCDMNVTGRTCIGPGELLVQIITGRAYAPLQHAFVKKTRMSSVDYPLLSVAAAKIDGRVRTAFSGVCGAPFRSSQIEEDLALCELSPASRVERAIGRLPWPIVDDILGSADYRKLVLKNVLEEIITELEGAS